MKSKHTRLLLATAIAALLAVDFQVEAQTTAKSTDQSTVSEGLAEIIVTARKRDESLQDTPLSLTVLSADSLKQMNITKLDDISEAVPNLNLSSNAEYPSSVVIYMRGVGDEDPVLTNDSPVALYLDGVYVARDIGALFTVLDFDRIEVLRGPQGSLFGRNTTGGAISLVSKAPSNDFNFRQSEGYASNAEVTSKTSIDTGTLGDTGLKARIAYEHHSMDGYVRNVKSDAADSPGADKTDALYLTLHDDFTDKLSADFRFDLTHQTGQLIDWQTTAAAAPAATYFGSSPLFGGAPYVVSPQYLSTVSVNPAPFYLETLGFSLTLTYEIIPAFAIKSISAYRSLEEAAQSNADGQSGLVGPVFNSTFTGIGGIVPVQPFDIACPNGPPPQGCDAQHQHQISQELQFSGDLDSVKYVGGLYYFSETVGEVAPNEFTIPIPTGDPALPYIGSITHLTYAYSGKSMSDAAFGQVVYTPPILDKKLQLTGGLRFTHDDKSENVTLPNPVTGARRFHDVSGEATVKYQWLETLQTYFRFSNAYKAGGFNARETAVNPAPGYEPEYANLYELGTHAELFERHMRVNADVFHTVYSNQQISTLVANPIAAGFITETINAGASTYTGGEIELNVLPAKGWRFDLSVGYVDPRYQTYLYAGHNIANIARFPYASKLTMDTAVQYDFPQFAFGALSARLGFGYKSGVVFASNPISNPLLGTLGSNALTDLGANVTLARIPLGWKHTSAEVSLYGKNLLDQHERIQGIDLSSLSIPGTNGGYGVDAYSRPLVVGINVSVQFR